MAELLRAFSSLMRSARAEKGLITTRLSVAADEENVIHYEERWESVEDLEEQVRSSRFTRFLALMEEASKRPSLEFHFVSETRGLEYVAALREQHC